jgi:hypothetical protein
MSHCSTISIYKERNIAGTYRACDVSILNAVGIVQTLQVVLRIMFDFLHRQ